MAISWIPKSTVPATLASVVYNDVLASGWKDKQVFGLNIQTTTILGIMVCEPIGAFLIDQFAPKLLTIDPSDPAFKNLGDSRVADQEMTHKEMIEKDLKNETKNEVSSASMKSIVAISEESASDERPIPITRPSRLSELLDKPTIPPAPQ